MTHFVWVPVSEAQRIARETDFCRSERDRWHRYALECEVRIVSLEGRPVVTGQGVTMSRSAADATGSMVSLSHSLALQEQLTATAQQEAADLRAALLVAEESMGEAIAGIDANHPRSHTSVLGYSASLDATRAMLVDRLAVIRKAVDE